MEEIFATKGTSPYIAAILIAVFWQMAGNRYYFTALRGRGGEGISSFTMGNCIAIKVFSCTFSRF